MAKYSPGSGAGQDSLLPIHLRDLTTESLGTVANDPLDMLCRFFNETVLPGNIPCSVCPTFYGAKLFGLSKPDGGIRPIAVGITLRRLISKLIMFKLKDSCKTTFLPYQVGVGITAGAESAIHSCRKFIKYPHDQPKVLLKVDFANAFNNVRRDIMLKELRSKHPEFYAMVWQAYSSGSNLFFGKDIIKSLTGLQQGDVLGPFLFALSIQKMVSELKSTFNIWYLDDGSLGGDPYIVLDDLKKYLNMGKS